MTPDNRISAWAMVLAAVIACIWAVQCREAQGKPTPWQTSLATQFGSKSLGDPVHVKATHDSLAGAVFACMPRGRVERMNPMVWGVASRTLPCGSIVEVCKGALCVTAPVVDRGPYRAVPTTCKRYGQRCWERGRTLLRIQPGWRYANDLDLLPRVAFAVRLGGKALVRWRVVYRARRKQ